MNKTEKSSALHSLTDIEIRTQISPPAAPMLETESHLLAGKRICDSTDYAKAKACCDEAGGKFYAPDGIGVTYYCKVSDHGTWDQD